MKATYEMSISELRQIIDLIIKGLKESEAFDRVLNKRHFEVKP